MELLKEPFGFVPPPGLFATEPRHQVIIVGAGPVGLVLALQLANQNCPVVVVDDNNVVSTGSRAICWSKRSLEILDRVGIGDLCAEKGVTWKLGRTFHKDREVFSFDLQPEEGHKRPAFVNLQQYHVERYLVAAASRHPLVELRFKNKVCSIEQDVQGVSLTVETPEGKYDLQADHVVACDGARSQIRGMMGLSFAGEHFEDRFLIADIEMKADFPSERRFWFEPNFHDGQSALLHRQPDDIYRIDLQLGPHADVEEEARPERVIPRIETMLGHSDFRLDWVSVYRFQCRRLEKFVHERVIFCGDSAHVVSPFGARGGNGGLQDADALAWRLASVANGNSQDALLQDYDLERQYAADVNIRNSSQATRFMTPAAGAERLFREAVLALAGHTAFAKGMVNSGRLSVPCQYPDFPDHGIGLPSAASPGKVAPDLPLGNGWLMDRLGERPVLLCFGVDNNNMSDVEYIHLPDTPLARQRYCGREGKAVYLIRPDQVISARFSEFDAVAIKASLARIWAR